MEKAVPQHRFLLFVFLGNEIQGDGVDGSGQLGVLDAGSFQHPLGDQIQHSVLILVGKIEHFFHTALDNRFGTLVAGEQGHIHPASPQIPAAGIENGVEFRMHHKGILRLRALPAPGEFIVGAALPMVCIHVRFHEFP